MFSFGFADYAAGAIAFAIHRGEAVTLALFKINHLAMRNFNLGKLQALLFMAGERAGYFRRCRVFEPITGSHLLRILAPARCVGLREV
jgi:hypothetical protein